MQSDAAAALVAQVYVLKGVISYVKDRNTAIAASEFVKALRYDDRARIDPMMSSPSLERVFNQARGQLRTNRDMDRGRRDSRRDDRRDSRRDDRRDSRRDDRRNSRRDDRYNDRYTPPPPRPPVRDRDNRRQWDNQRDSNDNFRRRYDDRRRDEEPMRHRRPRKLRVIAI